MCKEKRPAHSLCTRCNKWLCSSCTEEHRHGKEPGERFLPVSLKGCTGTGDTLGFPSFSHHLLSCKGSSHRLCVTQSQQEVMWFFSNFSSNFSLIATISIAHYRGKSLNVCVSQDLLHVPFHSMEWWHRVRRAANGLALLVFPSQFGSFHWESHDKAIPVNMDKVCEGVTDSRRLWSLQDVPFLSLQREMSPGWIWASTNQAHWQISHPHMLVIYRKYDHLLLSLIIFCTHMSEICCRAC